MLIKDKKLKLVMSYMLRYECGNNPFEMRRNAIFDFISQNTYAYVGNERKEVIEAKAAEIDYTKWQRDYFDVKEPETISEEASLFEKTHPFTGNAIRL